MRWKAAIYYVKGSGLLWRGEKGEIRLWKPSMRGGTDRRILGQAVRTGAKAN